MNKTMKTVVVLVLLVALFGGAYYAYSVYGKAAEPPKTAEVTQAQPTQTRPNESVPTETASEAMAGTPAPTTDSNLPKEIDFKLGTLDGRTVALSDYVGKRAVVLNFWATWCPPCRAEMPEFNKKASELGEDEVVFLMVNLTDGQRDTEQGVKRFLEQNKFTFKNVLLDKEFVAADAYSVSGIPTTLFINKDGYIVKSYTGSIDANALEEGIALALDK